MIWSAQKMIMFCIFRDVRACKEAKNWGENVLFLDKQKNFQKNNILVSFLSVNPLPTQISTS